MQVGGVTGCCLFVADRYGFQFSDLCEKILDQVPPVVGAFIIIVLELAIPLRDRLMAVCAVCVPLRFPECIC